MFASFTVAKWFTQPPGWKVGKLAKPKAIKKTQETIAEQVVVGWKYKFTEEGSNRNRSELPNVKLPGVCTKH